MKRFLTLTLGAIFVFTTLLINSFLLAPNVSATSVYDNVFSNPAQSIKIQRTYGATCDEVDITNNWGGQITNSANWISGYSGDSFETVNSAWTTALNNGTGWAISQNTVAGSSGMIASIDPTSPNNAGNSYNPGSATGDKFAIVTFNASSTNYVGFTDAWGLKYAFMGSTDETYTYTMLIFQDTNCNVKVYGTGKFNTFTSGTSMFVKSMLASDPTDWATITTNQPLFVNSTINYPQDYAGIQPLDSFSSAIDIKLTPRFELKGSYNSFSANYKSYITDPEINDIIPFTTILWSVKDFTNDNDPTSDITCEIVQLDITETFSYKDHCANAEFTEGNDYRVIATLGSFGISTGELTVGENVYNITFQSTYIELPIDKSSYEYKLGDMVCEPTSNQELGIGVSCSPPPRYTQCTFNVNDWGGDWWACESKNWFNTFVDTLSWLFVPAPKTISNALSFYGSDTFGLTAIITSPLTAIESMSTASCSQITLPLPFVGENVYLPCMTPIYQDYFGDFFDMYQLIITGAISYWILVRLLTRVKHAQEPKNNQIDVVDL